MFSAHFLHILYSISLLGKCKVFQKIFKNQGVKMKVSHIRNLSRVVESLYLVISHTEILVCEEEWIYLVFETKQDFLVLKRTEILVCEGEPDSKQIIFCIF